MADGLTRREAVATFAAVAVAASATRARAQTAAAAPRSGTVTTEGDTLYFETRGSGPPLLMISGATGDAGIYGNVAERLADTYQVICYDRRGNSRSTRNEPQNFDVEQQARDAVAVMRAAGHGSALVFANSGGAVIGLAMAKSQPQATRALIAHEPPVIRILPEAKGLAGQFAEIHQMAWRESPAKAYDAFRALVFGAGRPPMNEHMAKLRDVFARAQGNADFFVLSEMMPLTFYAPDVAAIKANGMRIVMAAGKDTLERGQFYGRTAQILAKQLNRDFVTFPGGNLSFMDRSDEWAATLREVLGHA